VWPGKSIVSAPPGIVTDARGPTASIRFPRTITTPSAIGGRPVASMTHAALSAIVRSCAITFAGANHVTRTAAAPRTHSVLPVIDLLSLGAIYRARLNV